jgi:hypothetical protein
VTSAKAIIWSRFATALAALLIAKAALSQVSETWEPGLHRDLALSHYSSLATNAEIARRVLSPLTSMRLDQALERSGKGLRAQPIDLQQEHFLLYVPRQMPEGGYGLIVFMPPWDRPSIPAGWQPVLDRLGLLFVSASASGNEASILGRRIPLAVTAAYDLTQRYRIVPRRVYVAGFSGGSRVALRVALGYPDVFRGAFLNSGSDPIGTAEAALPPADLMAAFQESSHLVLASGNQDGVNVEQDASSTASLHRWCVMNVQTFVIYGMGHEPAGTGALTRAVEAMDRDRDSHDSGLERCRATLETQLGTALRRLHQLEVEGRIGAANEERDRIDREFGGLAILAR